MLYIRKQDSGSRCCDFCGDRKNCFVSSNRSGSEDRDICKECLEKGLALVLSPLFGSGPIRGESRTIINKYF